jgi:hypothetical protein
VSDHLSNEPVADHLDIGGSRPAKRHKGWWIGGGVLGVLAVVGGASVWAAVSFFGQGAQPAEALPDSTIGYVSIDLDPSGSQKIAALELARKFPAFKDEVGLRTGDDVRKWLFEQMAEDTGCKLDFDEDVDSWLGSRAAVAAVGTEKPAPVVVVQTDDGDKARAGVERLLDCGGEADDVGWAVDGDWIVFAESTDQAEQVVAQTKKGSLADDPDFKSWTDRAGDSGILTAYAAPAAGQALAQELGGFAAHSAAPSPSPLDPFGLLGSCPGLADPGASSQRMQAKLADFGGAAATLRFSDDGVELETVGDMRAFGAATLTEPSRSPVIASLPADTAAAIGLALPKNWVATVTQSLQEVCGADTDPRALLAPLSGATGLDLPGDLEKLLGDSAALALGPDLDVEGLVNGGDPADLPLALKVRGDEQIVEQVTTRLRQTLAAPEGVLEPVAGDDGVAVGLDKTFTGKVAKGGDLGSSKTFTGVIPDADKASAVLYVSFDALRKAIDAVASGDDSVTANLAPLQALGLSGWTDGDVSHGVVRISLD